MPLLASGGAELYLSVGLLAYTRFLFYANKPRKNDTDLPFVTTPVATRHAATIALEIPLLIPWRRRNMHAMVGCCIQELSVCMSQHREPALHAGMWAVENANAASLRIFLKISSGALCFEI